MLRKYKNAQVVQRLTERSTQIFAWKKKNTHTHGWIPKGPSKIRPSAIFRRPIESARKAQPKSTMANGLEDEP